MDTPRTEATGAPGAIQNSASHGARPQVISAADLEFAYRGVPVIGPLDFSLHSGHAVAIMAPVGAGKSTLIRLLLGVQRPDRGIVHCRVPPSDIGVAFQEDNLLPWLTVAENLRLLNSLHGHRVREDEVHATLRELQLEGYEHFLPHELSSGMRQKVAIGRLLLYAPRLYVLDESLAHVDEIARSTLCGAISDRIVRAHSSAILITHNPTDALQVADTIWLASRRPLKLRMAFQNPLGRAARAMGSADAEFRRTLDLLVAELDHA